ncbi:MAG: hypothetical protein VX130_07290 [Verrucomicrobiota bacterium]|nr:hypothetical protein [Verrucomicrobiota bacterium]
MSLILGLSKKEVLHSDLVKELCADLVNGQVIVINSEKRKFSSIGIDAYHAKQTWSKIGPLPTH